MPELFCICVSKEEDIIKIGEIIGKLAIPGSIFALKGELGAGKTVLVKGIARGLGVKEEPNSPTFVIMNAYQGRLPLYHFDLYRITSIEELEGIGYEEFFFGKGVSVVEWADRIEELFPDNTIKVEIQIPEGEDTKSERRKLKIEGDKKWLSSFKNMVGQVLQT